MKKFLILLLTSCIVLMTACGSASKKDDTSSSSDDPATVVSGETTDGTETTVPPASARASHTQEEYAEYGVDELNYIPILMYHRIYDMRNSETEFTGGNVDAGGFNRTSEAFEADLERFYEQGYRMIRLTDYVDGYIDTEFGYSPLIITFDDGIEDVAVTGRDANGDLIFAENCAVSILERVKARHPDYNVTATFFLNKDLFCQNEYNEEIVKWMVDHGYDIGNHTKDHGHMGEMTADQIVEQVGYMYDLLESIIPGRYVNIIALPYGEPVLGDDPEPRYDGMFAGTYNGTSYTTKCTLLVGWMRQESPFAAGFDPYYVKRIRAYDNNGEDFDLQFNFDLLNNGWRYISDGDPDTIVTPEQFVDEYLGDTHGKELITY